MKKGFTLIEITIVIIITALIIFPITIFFNSTIKSFFYGKPSNKVLEVVTDAMREVEDLLRGASEFETIESQKVKFKLKRNFGNNEYNITISQDGDFIKKINEVNEETFTIYVPYYNNSNTPSDEKINLTINFKYYDLSFNETTDIDSVYLIEITISGEPYVNPLETPEFELKNMVRLRNR